MNILFLIGNGFDLALRLGTSYASFYHDYKENHTINKNGAQNICDEFLLGMIEKACDNNKLWSDLELAIGRFDYQCLCSEKWISVSNRAADIKWILEDALRAFLSKRQISFKTNMSQAHNIVRTYALMKMQQLLSLIVQTCEMSESYNIKSIKFLSLNYTDSLEFLYGDHFKIHHAHRSLKDGALIFGVDNHNQLTNDMGPHEQLLTKLGQLQTNLLEWVEKDTRRMIYDSDIIVCYGLSLGATDNRIWRMIRERLDRSRLSRVILCPYLKDIEKSRMCDRELCSSSLRQRFFDAITEQYSTHEELQNRYDAQILVMPFIKEYVNDNETYSNDYFGLDHIADMLGISEV